MKLLSIIAQKPYATGSGVYLTEVANALDKAGYQQAIVCGVQHGDPDFQDYKKISPVQKIYPLEYGTKELPYDVLGMSDVMPYPSTSYKNLTQKQAQLLEQNFLNLLQKVIQDFEPDIILCHHLYFLTALVQENIQGIKLGAICHGTCLRQLESNDFERDRIIEAIGKMEYVFALQQEQKREIEQLFNIPPNKIAVVGNGYNPEIFWQEEVVENNPKRSFNEKGQRILRIVYAGKISINKGVMSLLRAMEEIRPTGFEIQILLAGGSGDMEEYQKIQQAAQESYHQVKLLGHLSQEELSQLYRRSDLFVFPSYYEGLGLAPIEAMACGLPAVISNTAGIKDYLLDHIKEPPVKFVDLPAMVDKDIPKAEELPDFEKRLQMAVQTQIDHLMEGKISSKPLGIEKLSWGGVARKIMNFLEK